MTGHGSDTNHISTAPSPVVGYMPALDGIRALAIAGVLMAHFLPRTSILRDVAHWGRLGVVLFFVLSGFLITSILIRVRGRIESAHSQSRRGVLWSFYGRRFLRIFPIYYLTVGLVSLLDSDMRKEFAWHVTYTSNYLMAYDHSAVPYARHLWSLAVEEQFYLFWPWLLLFLPRRLLPHTLWSLVIVSTAYKFIGGLYGLSWAALTRPVYGNTDALALGGLLALHREPYSPTSSASALLLKFSARFALPFFIATQFARYQSGEGAFRTNIFYVGFNDLFASLVFATLISAAASSRPTWFKSILSARPVRYIGKVSYGIYLYHLFVRHGVEVTATRFSLPLPAPGLWRFMLYTGLSILVAVISWELIERPINSMKKAFPYFRSRSPQVKVDAVLSAGSDETTSNNEAPKNRAEHY